jgi:receptor protein-tyrosine kinase
MSRVHDALRKAAQQERAAEVPKPAPRVPPPPPPSFFEPPEAPPIVYLEDPQPVSGSVAVAADVDDMEAVIRNVEVIPYSPAKEALLVSPMNPREAPAEEFRTIRTRLNHMQTLQPLHTLVVTSASPAEGKSFTAMNLAVTQSQLADKRVLLADFDFRRTTVDKNFQLSSSPGITNYLMGEASLDEVIKKVDSSNLYVMPAGQSVPNPLELLNLKECRALINGLRSHFDWVIIDSPPLLFAADGNLLATMCDGTILVVRIGTTTFDSVTRALQSLCENNVLGVVVNGARRGELYSKYTYYHDYYYAPESEEGEENTEGRAEQTAASVEP